MRQSQPLKHEPIIYEVYMVSEVKLHVSLTTNVHINIKYNLKSSPV